MVRAVVQYLKLEPR